MTEHLYCLTCKSHNDMCDIHRSLHDVVKSAKTRTLIEYQSRIGSKMTFPEISR